MMYLARKGLNDFQVVEESEADQTPQLTHLVNRGYTIYQVLPQGGGHILLKKQRVRVDSSTKEVYASVLLEDDV